MSRRPLKASSVDGQWAVNGERDGRANDQFRVLPDACVDLIWVDGALRLVGPDRVARVVVLSPGADACGVRLRPGRSGDVLGVPGDELVDAQPLAADVLGRRIQPLETQLEAAAPSARPRILAAWVEAAAARAAGPDPAVAQMVLLLEREPSRGVRALADDLGFSERQLRRRVSREIGYSPKLLARVVRLQRLLRLATAADAAPDPAWLAVDAGYVDQAHLGHEARALTALSAGELLATHS